ncbi:tetratricopeptide repeat protein [Chitinimonas sp. PSY-7]|uniref:tetratricopeptide repeat protein n=1 Tax=Chitinimonas sp. PSY-7 TaxID=3459088 RepID=UPI00404017EC
MPAPQLLCLILAATVLSPAFASEADDKVAAELAHGQAADALKLADQALLQKPRDARLRLLKGNALASLGRTSEAIQTYTALTNDYPNLPEPYNNLAALYAQQGQLDKARTTLQKALQTNPTYATAHTNLADVYAKLAAQAYEKALQRDVVERSQSTPARQPVPASSSAKLVLVQDLLSRNAAPSVSVAANSSPPVTKPPSSPPVKTPVQAQVSPPAPVSQPPAAVTQPVKPPIVVASATPPAKPVPTPVPPPPSKPVEKPPIKPVDKPTAIEKPADKPKEATDTEQQIHKSILAWADAWSDKRVSAYLASYAKNFKPSGQSRADWEQQRRDRINGAKKISVKLDKLRIKLDDDRATVRFVQRYTSDRLDSSTGKTLILEKNGSRWLIVEERVG